jgi:hypothetical protein
MSMNGHLRLVTPTQLDWLQEAPERTMDFIFDENAGSRPDELDLHKSWQALHFLLTQTAWDGEFPLSFLVSGGEPLDDTGYGPARSFTSPEVKQIATALDAVSPQSLRERFDPKALDEAEVYPGGWAASFDEQQLPHLLGQFEELAKFMRRGADSHQAMLIWLS